MQRICFHINVTIWTTKTSRGAYITRKCGSKRSIYILQVQTKALEINWYKYNLSRRTNVAKVSPWSHEAAKCYWFKRVTLRVGREKLFNTASPESLSFHHAETLWCSQGCDVIQRTWRCAELFPPHSWPGFSSTRDTKDAFKTLTGYQLLYHHIISFSYTFTPPRRCHDCTFAVSLLLLATFFTSCLSFFFFFFCLFWPQNRRSLSRNRRSTSQPRWRRWWTFPVRLEVSCVCLCVRINPLKLKQLVGVLFCCTWHIFYSPWSWSGDCFSLQYTGVAPLCKQENHGCKWD